MPTLTAVRHRGNTDPDKLERNTFVSMEDTPDPMERMPPWDLKAEQWLIGAAMNRRRVMHEVVEMLEPDDFYRPQHQIIWLAMVSLYAQGYECDPVSLWGVIEEREQQNEATGIRGRLYLHDLYDDAMSVLPGTASQLANRVRELSGRRRIIDHGTRMIQAAYMMGADLPDVVALAQAEVSAAMMSAADARSIRADLSDVGTFLRRVSERQDIVIPGLLERQDRVIIVGFEGDGKSTLSYQLAVCAACGIHPFTFEPIPPIRVTIMDWENPPHLIRRKVGLLQPAAELIGTWRPDNLHVLAHPAGIDLTRQSDQFRVMEIVRQTKPDLVIAGPILKMLTDDGKQGSEALHSQFTRFWDRVREAYGPAVWFEHHAPKGERGARELTPFGSGVYMRWPEFGIGLKRGRKGELLLSRFRGDREEGRCWPEKITRNTGSHPRFPWQAIYPAGTFHGQPQGSFDDDEAAGGES